MDIRPLLLFALILLLSNCSGSLHSITVDQDALVKIGSENAVAKKRGEKFDTDGKNPVYIESSGYASVVISPSDVSSEYNVTLIPLDVSMKEFVRKQTDEQLDEILPQINAIQQSISKGQSKEALTAAITLETQFPKVGFIKLLKAVALVHTGDKPQAIEVLQRLMVENPNHKTGKAFLNSLSGTTSDDRLPATKEN